MSAELFDGGEFFAPSTSDAIDSLVSQYNTTRAKIEAVGAFMAGADTLAALHYFLDGNADEEQRRYSVNLAAQKLFRVEGAVKALNSAYWSKALAFTDVLNSMPQARRDEWHKTIKERTTPDFTDATVRSTLSDLLSMRGQFLAERVDGIFRALSGTHVTNRPEGFSKRMILANVIQSYGLRNVSKVGVINDLRCVIAKFMGRDEPHYSATDSVIDFGRYNTGEWMSVDGGALRIRVYGVGTAHLEVHPEMAWRLNAILAQLYPTAIPAPHRTKPKKQLKEIRLMDRPLPFAVLSILEGGGQGFDLVEASGGRWGHDRRYIPNSWALRNHVGINEGNASPAYAEAARVLELIGGVKKAGAGNVFTFPYDPERVIKEIVVSGCIPDQVSHQFYPTPEDLAAEVLAAAEIDGTHTVLEPSAGVGGIARLLPNSGSVTCVEVSDVFCRVLQELGMGRVESGDFLGKSFPAFDRVVMNPPFDQGRWPAHVQHAATMVKDGGRLVAILPSGAVNSLKTLGDGWTLHYSPPMKNRFPCASVDVVMLVANYSQCH